MLREAVERCPADEWSNADHKNAFWQVLEYWSFCDRIVDDAVDALDLDSAESGGRPAAAE